MRVSRRVEMYGVVIAITRFIRSYEGGYVVVQSYLGVEWKLFIYTSAVR